MGGWHAKSEVLQNGENVALIAIGNMVEETIKAVDKLAKENIAPTLVNARFVKPVDCDMILKLAQTHSSIVVVEEGIKKGGYGEGVEAFIAENGLKTKVCVMAIDDCFVEQGAVDSLRERIGISHKNIYDKVLELIR